MAIVRLTHDGYGMLETNRIDRSYNEAQCSLDTTAFPNGAENGTIVAVDKPAGTVKITGALKGILGNSELIYDQFHAGLKNYKVEAGKMASVYFLRDGDTFTTNTVCYEADTFTDDAGLATAIKNGGCYGKPNADTGVIEINKTFAGSPFTVVKMTTMPDGQKAVKFIVTDITAL